MAITKVTSGMVNPDPSDASNLSTGSVPLAQLGNAPATDLTPLQNDIAILALNSAVQNNQTAHNLSNAFIDQYEDSTGIDATTNVSRNTSGEYVSSITTDPLAFSTTYATNSTAFAKWGSSSIRINWTTGTSARYVMLNSAQAFASGLTNFTIEGWTYVNPSTDYYWLFRWSDTDPVTTTPSAVMGFRKYTGGYTTFYNARYNQANSVPDVTGWTGDNLGTISGSAWKHFAVNRVGNTLECFYDGTRTTSTDLGTSAAFSAMPWFMIGAESGVEQQHCDDYRLSNTNRYALGSTITVPSSRFTSDSNTCFLLQSIDETDGTAITASQENGPGDITSNATGNYTSTTETANATVSKMGIVVLYKNESGTATLDTDLVAQVSADGGSNYVSAPLTAGGTFSAGILIAESNDITISNTGTTPKFKISFANQASGSKETRVYGAALLY
jgi:hypothetical protein